MVKSKITPTILDHQYENLITEMPPGIVFIIGSHRSGTTFLHQTLVRTDHFKFVSAYDILCYDELIHNRQTGVEAQRRDDIQQLITGAGENRHIDDCLVGDNFPEEFGFILPKDESRFLFAPQVIPENRSKFTQLCGKKQFLNPDKRPILLKNPNEFYSNFSYIHETYPTAKLIFIHRHPLKVLNSNIHAWGKMLKQKNHYFSLVYDNYKNLFGDGGESKKRRTELQLLVGSNEGIKWIFSELIKSYHYYVQHIENLPKESYISTRYEDLCTTPEGSFAEIFQFLNLNQNMESLLKDVRPRNTQIIPQVQSAYEECLEGVKFYLEFLEYSEMPTA